MALGPKKISAIHRIGHMKEKRVSSDANSIETELFALQFAGAFNSEDPDLFDSCFLKQVHGAEIVERTQDNKLASYEADGQFTSLSGLRLAIRTADCVPLMIYSPVKHLAVALHLGWRGVAARLASKCIHDLGLMNDNLEFYLGPHIQFGSFEVGAEVIQALNVTLNEGYRSDPELVCEKPNEKFLCNLARYIYLQCAEAMSSEFFWWQSTTDTFTNKNFYSFRRDKTAQRNVSWIKLK